jgi:hypothetical protein
MGTRAAAREGWLLPVGALIALLRSLLAMPALAVGAVVVVRAADRAAAHDPRGPLAALEAVAALLTSPRFLALVGGLWLAGTLLAGLLRILFLAGALPTLGARLAGVDATRRFAPGVAWGLPRQVSTWLLAGAAELAAAGYLVVATSMAVRLAASSPAGQLRLALAVVGGAAIAIGFAGLLATRVLGDAAAARTAILGEGAAYAYAGATRRFLVRPGGFLLGGIAVGLAGAAAWGALRPAAGVVAAVHARVIDAVAVGPEMMLALLALLAAAAVDLAWLGTAGALACAEEAEDPSRRLSA